MTHGHEVLRMMEGNSYASAEELVTAIVEKFGANIGTIGGRGGCGAVD